MKLQLRQKLPFRFALLLAPLFALALSSQAQSIFSCSSFTSTGSCGVTFNGSGGQAFHATSSGSISGGVVDMVPVGTGHTGTGFWYQTAVNDQAFTSTFTFVPNGYNLAFCVQNANNNGGSGGLSSGAGGEGGFSQFAAGGNIAPNNVFCLQLDSYSSVSNSPGTFTYSTAQIYQTLQAPYMPNTSETAGYLAAYPINKISTSPVALNSPSSSAGTTTGDTYSATVTYDGQTLTLNMYDVTASGSCPGASCFSNTWSNVYIPGIAGATTAYVGFAAGTAVSTTNPILIGSFSYTVNTPATLSGFTAWNANSTYNDGTVSSASPVYSVAPGSYAGAQTVAITTATTPSNYICYVLAATPPAIMPQPDNNGGCNAGTLYSSPVSITSTKTLYAMAGSNNSAFATGVVGATGDGPPSSLVAGTYTIGAAGAATPTFSPVAGTYSSAQLVTISTTAGGVICYNNTGSPATNGSTGCTAGTLYSGAVTVASNETLYAVAGGTGYTDSSVGSAAYVINSAATLNAHGFSGKLAGKFQ